jgi:hypothetical protein
VVRISGPVGRGYDLSIGRKGEFIAASRRRIDGTFSVILEGLLNRWPS